MMRGRLPIGHPLAAFFPDDKSSYRRGDAEFINGSRLVYPMEREAMLTLLQELITCHSPASDESEIEPIIRREFEATGATVWQDGSTNIYAHLPGDGPKVMIAATLSSPYLRAV